MVHDRVHWALCRRWIVVKNYPPILERQNVVSRSVRFLTLRQFVHPAAKVPANSFRDRHQSTSDIGVRIEVVGKECMDTYKGANKSRLALMYSGVTKTRHADFGAAVVWPADGDDYVTA
jgi:hypothetical protein